MGGGKDGRECVTCAKSHFLDYNPPFMWFRAYVVNFSQSRLSFSLPFAISRALLPHFLTPKPCFILPSRLSVLTWWIWPTSSTRMKSIFCFSSFIVRLFVHCFSQREANSVAFDLVVHAVSCKPITDTRTRTCSGLLVTVAFLSMEVFSLSPVFFEATYWPAHLLWLWPSHFISGLFFSCFIWSWSAFPFPQYNLSLTSIALLGQKYLPALQPNCESRLWQSYSTIAQMTTYWFNLVQP